MRRAAARSLLADIALWRENVLDLETAVDDCRQAANHSLEAFDRACRDRHRAVEHLSHLIAFHASMSAPPTETMGLDA